MQASDLTPAIDTSNFHLVFLFSDGKARLVTAEVPENLKGTNGAMELMRREVGTRFADLLMDPKLNAIVVIDGLMVYTTYTAAMFRWLCGVGPNPNGSDPEWMG